MPLRESVIATPLRTKALRLWLTVYDGRAAFRTANAPATWGAAIEVPYQLQSTPSRVPSGSRAVGTAEQMSVRGAHRSTRRLLLEPPVAPPRTAGLPAALVSVALPTTTALLKQAG